MRIRQIKIKRFRGIRELSWNPKKRLVCLIGPGDTCKSTILAAVELALTPRAEPAFSDTDFYDLDHSEPIGIEVTVTDLPEPLLPLEKFGNHLRGWSRDSGLVDEPEDGCLKALTVKLTVESSLEASWVVANERDEKPISRWDRARLGALQLGSQVAQHLTWSRHSTLGKLTGRMEETKPLVTEALRNARKAISDPETELKTLREIATRVQVQARELGAATRGDFRPGLNLQALSLRYGPLSLHEEEVPLTAAGSGTQRLTAIAVQRLGVEEGAILLIDEVETGLEPHRIRHLLHKLDVAKNVGQVILTSHSPTTIQELRAQQLYVVRSVDGVVDVQEVGEELQGTVRSSSEALLCKSIVVCEGKTELGICRGLRDHWGESREGLPLTHVGTHFIEGEGSSAAARALDLAKLGYRSALFVDSDVELGVTLEEMESSGVALFQWPGKVCTEERLCVDLPWESVLEIVELAKRERGAESVVDSVAERLGLQPHELDLAGTPEDAETESSYREAIGAAAKKQDWLKRVALGEEAGRIVAKVPSIPESNLAKTLRALEIWAYGDDS